MIMYETIALCVLATGLCLIAWIAEKQQNKWNYLKWLIYYFNGLSLGYHYGYLLKVICIYLGVWIEERWKYLIYIVCLIFHTYYTE